MIRASLCPAHDFPIASILKHDAAFQLTSSYPQAIYLLRLERDWSSTKSIAIYLRID